MGLCRTPWFSRGWVLVAGLLGCAPATRRHADSAWEQGNLPWAETLYEQAVAANPQDPHARGRLQAVRTRMVQGQLRQAEQELRDGSSDRGFDTLEQALRSRIRWNLDDQSTLVQEATPVLRLAKTRVASEVDSLLAKGAPFSAWSKWKERSRLLSMVGFEDLRDQTQSKVQAAGRAKCAEMKAQTSEPYLSRLRGRYCEAFGSNAPREDGSAIVTPLPHTFGTLQVAATVDGLDEGQQNRMRASLGSTFQRSPWYDPAAPRTLDVEAQGTLRTDLQSSPVTQRVSWTEKVPYQTTEVVQVPRIVSYPYTTFRFGPEPWGRSPGYWGRGPGYWGPPSRSFGVGTRTLLVPETRVVTRYRDEPRETTFQAQELRGTYESRLVLTFRLPKDGATWTVQDNEKKQRVELEHSMNLPAAGLRPNHPKLPTADDWLDERLSRLEGAFGSRLREAFAQSFCTASSYDLEGAARCALTKGEKAPPAVIATLEGTFGADTRPLLAYEGP